MHHVKLSQTVYVNYDDNEMTYKEITSATHTLSQEKQREKILTQN